MRYKVGDTVVHPYYGAGVVTAIKELGLLADEKKRYYWIKLLSDPGTIVTVPIGRAEKLGLRPSIPQSELSQVWHVLRSDPQVLPSDHNERYALLRDKLHGGDALQIAEALRDMAWRREQRRNLTAEGKRLYEQAIRYLSTEIAVTQDSDPSLVETQILRALQYQVT